MTELCGRGGVKPKVIGGILWGDVEFGWFTASNPSQNSTRRDSEKRK